MEERRRCKRLELDVMVELERLVENSVTTSKYVRVAVLDISKSGIGFFTEQQLEEGTFYDAKLEIWTKEIIEAVIKIVRRKERDGYYEYGGVFVGMNETDALKIEIYQLVNDRDSQVKM